MGKNKNKNKNSNNQGGNQQQPGQSGGSGGAQQQQGSGNPLQSARVQPQQNPEPKMVWGPPQQQQLPQQQQQPSGAQNPKNQKPQKPQQVLQNPQQKLAWGPPQQQQQQQMVPQQQPSGTKKQHPQPQQTPQNPPPGFSQQPSFTEWRDPTEKPKQQSQQPSKSQTSQTKMLAMIESSPDGKVYEGTRGRKCNLEVNYLQILVNKLIETAYHYDVEFNPPTPKKFLVHALDEFMRQNFPNVLFAFDGRKNFYTNQLLKVKDVVLDGELEKEVKAVMGDRSKDFKVKVKFATEVDMSVLKSYKHPSFEKNDKPSQAIQCLDVILRTAFKALTGNNRAVTAGRALYFPNQRPIDLSEGLELWYGLFQSAILGRSSLFLNVDVAHKAFPSAVPLLELLKNFCRDPRNPDRDVRVPDRIDGRMAEQLKDYLKMLSIGYRLSPNEPVKTFSFNDLVKPASEALFVDDDGKKMTVQEYFRNVKRINLRFPNLPCLHVGSRIRNIYLPMEFCEIPAGQATNKKCTPNAVAQMIRYSATSTDERKKKIQDLLKRIDYSCKDVQSFGIGVDARNFQNVEGRVINPPNLQYRGKTVTPRGGVWRGENFLETQNDEIKWAVINCDDRTNIQQVKSFKDDIMKVARTKGMRLANSVGDNDYFPINMMRARPGELSNMLKECLKRGYKIVFVIIIDRNDCYAKVKQAAELEVGILTQCIKANTIFRMGRGNPLMTIDNILLKVNAKLNGKNQEVNEQSYQKYNTLNDGVMFIGADVTHPSPDQRDIPSVVGVACSYDQVGFRYQCAWRLQNPTKEMIEDLRNILTEHLKFYQQKNGKLPGKIMYYRDGVSEGQFSEVLSIEMTAIREAMKAVYGTKPPAKVTFIVVQKRHHTRFFPTQKEFCDGKNNNVPAGTVVDKDIVHPFQYQFFLASHAAIQGVTKPSKYCVLVNESKISPDDLQAITYDLCHLFTRCNRSVSYPAPTYYAHLVAARGKQYIIGRKVNMANLQREYRLIHSNIVNNAPMFFV